MRPGQNSCGFEKFCTFSLDKLEKNRYNSTRTDKGADLAHLVERHLAKVEVASSSLVVRSRQTPRRVLSSRRFCVFQVLSPCIPFAAFFRGSGRSAPCPQTKPAGPLFLGTGGFLHRENQDGSPSASCRPGGTLRSPTSDLPAHLPERYRKKEINSPKLQPMGMDHQMEPAPKRLAKA